MKTRHIQVIAAAALMLAPLSAWGSFINYSAREINIKIVYFGPSTGSLRANLSYIYARTSPESKGKLIQLETDGGQVAFFDFLPLALGEIRGFKVRFHLYTVPGGEGYSASRRLMLKGVDGVVFVADPDPGRLKATQKSWAELQSTLAALGYAYKDLPVVVQVPLNERGASLSADRLSAALKLSGHPVFVATPAGGEGVFRTLKSIAKQTLMVLKKEPK